MTSIEKRYITVKATVADLEKKLTVAETQYKLKLEELKDNFKVDGLQAGEGELKSLTEAVDKLEADIAVQLVEVEVKLKLDRS